MTKDLKLFFDNFDKLAESPGGVQKIRELILQLAVQGKLVPQDPNDEPASELLKKIKTEKEKLIKDGKIKKQKPLALIKTNEMPIKLPLNWAFVRLGDISNIVYGKNLPVKDLTNEGYPVWGANGIIGCYSKYLYEESQLLISCRGAYSGKINISPPNAFITNNSLVLEMTPIVKTSMYYLFYCLTALDKTKLVSGSAQPQVTTKNASPLIIPIPPLAEQKRIVAKVDELMVLCDELEEKQQKAAHSKIVLNNSALDHLLNAETAKEFDKFWQLICNSFDLLYNDPQNVDKLRQAVLQLAVQGKLVPQDPADEPASELLKKIKAEKEILIKEGKIRKRKTLPPIEPDEIPYELPKGWEWARLEQMFYSISTSKKKVKTSDLKKTGRLPVIDQGQKYISGYTDELTKLIKLPGAVIVFGDHTRVLKYVDFDFVAGADGIKILRPIKCYEKYFYVVLQAMNVADRGYGRHYKLLLCNLFPLPPLAEQKRIVSKVDKLMTLCAELEEQLKQSEAESEKLMESVVHHLLYQPLPEEQAITDEKQSRTPYKDDAAVVCFLLAEMEKLHRPTTEFFIQKHIFVTKHHLHLPVNSLFVRKVAGPWSHELKRKAIFAAVKMNWLRWEKSRLVSGPAFEKALSHAATVLGESAAKITKLVDDLKAFGNNGLERWTTVLKVVEDLKEQGQPITQDNIQREIDNWPGKSLKEIFAKESINHTIVKMVKYNWLPPSTGQ